MCQLSEKPIAALSQKDMSKVHDFQLYLIHAQDTDLYKIGFTRKSLFDTLKVLSKQDDREVFLTSCIRIANGQKAEKFFNDKYKSNKQKGGWFKFNEQQVSELSTLFKNYELDPNNACWNSNTKNPVGERILAVFVLILILGSCFCTPEEPKPLTEDQRAYLKHLQYQKDVKECVEKHGKLMCDRLQGY